MTSSSTIRPNKTEARKLQREKKRTAHLENINKDLNLPSESKISERKDRRVQKNNVLGFQYSMALKTREKVRTFIVRDEVNLNLTNFFTVFTSQRINELQLYISLELFDNEDELRAIKLELKGLIQNKLDMYDLCDTSSDNGKKRKNGMNGMNGRISRSRRSWRSRRKIQDVFNNGMRLSMNKTTKLQKKRKRKF